MILERDPRGDVLGRGSNVAPLQRIAANLFSQDHVGVDHVDVLLLGIVRLDDRFHTRCQCTAVERTQRRQPSVDGEWLPKDGALVLCEVRA